MKENQRNHDESHYICKFTFNKCTYFNRFLLKNEKLKINLKIK